MKTNTTIKGLERRLRSTKVYTDWVRRNRSAWCFRCNCTQDLECHHIVSLYHIMLGLFNLYGDAIETLNHAESMHKEDRVECVTLCSKCHGKRHPGRIASRSSTEIRLEEWVAIPRNWWFQPAHSTKDKNKEHLSLITLQVLFGIGWFILNGRMDNRMITVNRRRFAELIKKKPGTSFNRSFDLSLRSLQRIDVLAAKHRDHNDVELHISPNYIEKLVDNPWFFPLDDIPSQTMCSLMLKWFLSHQCGKRHYHISLKKLIRNLGINEKQPSKVVRMLQNACEDIPGAKMRVDEGQCYFELQKRCATPVFTLREMLQDCLLE